jgi:hypothetical protein
MIKKYLILFVLVVFTYACKKEGPGGKNTLVVFPKHHSKSIPNTTVYIKYGTNQFPGEDVAVYDDKLIAKPMAGEPDAHVHFENLRKGKYYLYGIGYDSAIAKTVKGGIPVEIKTKVGETEVTLPITED